MTAHFLLGHWLDGKALLAGALVLMVAATMPMIMGDSSALRRLGTLLAVIGAGMILSSATPWPVRGPVLLGWGLALIAWQVLDRRSLAHRSWRHAGRLAVIATVLLLLALELPWHRSPVLPDRNFDTLVVIGDSLSAGIGGAADKTWPRLLAQHHQITLDNLAVPGATVSTALDDQMARINDEAALVIVLIGGNDLLRGTPANPFENALAALLDAAQAMDRMVVMFELPTLPGRTHYTGIQRRLARKYNVPLIPRRHLLRVIREPANTTDGIHLTDRGHRVMFEMVTRLLGDRLVPVGQAASSARSPVGSL